MVAVADDKRYLPDSLAGVPKVTPETVRAYKNRPHDFEKAYRILRRENPVIAQELLVSAERATDTISEKQAFAEGALFVYSLISLGIQAQRLEELFTAPANDGVGGVDQPLST